MELIVKKDLRFSVALVVGSKVEMFEGQLRCSGKELYTKVGNTIVRVGFKIDGERLTVYQGKVKAAVFLRVL